MNADWAQWIIGIAIAAACAVLGIMWREIEKLRSNYHRLAGEMLRITAEFDMLRPKDRRR